MVIYSASVRVGVAQTKPNHTAAQRSRRVSHGGGKSGRRLPPPSSLDDCRAAFRAQIFDAEFARGSTPQMVKAWRAWYRHRTGVTYTVQYLLLSPQLFSTECNGRCHTLWWHLLRQRCDAILSANEQLLLLLVVCKNKSANGCNHYTPVSLPLDRVAGLFYMVPYWISDEAMLPGRSCVPLRKWESERNPQTAVIHLTRGLWWQPQNKAWMIAGRNTHICASCHREY